MHPDYNYIQVALELALEKHEGQTRRNGQPYFDAHLYPVFNLVDEVYQKDCFKWSLPIQFDSTQFIAIKIGAILHDAIEDKRITEIEMRKIFPAFYVDVIMLVTRKEGQTYFDFIQGILEGGAASFCAKIIKLADLLHNMSDLNEGSLRDKYRFAYSLLSREYPPY